VDLRDEVVQANGGKTYSWRPLSGVRYIVIHHMGVDYEGDAVVALWSTDRYHREDNHWRGGFGYHLTACDGVVAIGGDLSTARANVANRNHEVIGILWPRNGSVQVPTERDLAAMQIAIALAKEAAPLAIVVGHRDIALDGSVCPGSRWLEWKGLLDND
jgi:hypothetical protein